MNFNIFVIITGFLILYIIYLCYKCINKPKIESFNNKVLPFNAYYELTKKYEYLRS